jgi:hypothetical protein
MSGRRRRRRQKGILNPVQELIYLICEENKKSSTFKSANTIYPNSLYNNIMIKWRQPDHSVQAWILTTERLESISRRVGNILLCTVFSQPANLWCVSGIRLARSRVK